MSPLISNGLLILSEIAVLVILFYLLNLTNKSVVKQLLKSQYFSQEQKDNFIKIRQNLSRLFLFAEVVLIIFVLAVDAWLIYQQKDLTKTTFKIISSVPRSFWLNLGLALLKTLGVIFLGYFALKWLHKYLQKASDYVKNKKLIAANDEQIDEFFQVLDRSLINGLRLGIVALCLSFFNLPETIYESLWLVIKLYLIISIGLVIAKTSAAIVNTIDSSGYKLATEAKNAKTVLRFYHNFRSLIPFAQTCLKYAIYIGTAILAFQQVEWLNFLIGYGQAALRIVSIVFVTKIAVKVADLFIEYILLQGDDNEEKYRRSLTFVPLGQNFCNYFIYFWSGFIILRTIDMDPTPVLAGAGIVGLAVGLGAQNVIDDVVNGISILFQNYYIIGDYIQTDDGEGVVAEGIVEAIDLRTTRIRALTGQVYILRNGSINKIVNYSKDYVYAVVEVSVDADANLDRIYAILSEVGKKIKQQNSNVLNATRIDGLENLDSEELLISTSTKVKPGKHIAVQRQLRKMIREALNQADLSSETEVKESDISLPEVKTDKEEKSQSPFSLGKKRD
ncbi:mechanosensitive ion channel family protein [Oscillatoria salina]|uniref:mechanosensitive ion channel family protein n=1 Tax=Oscillatoria salina TaxID=331517 RepID=UPI0013BCADD3|nr:mechanosensitive ion channel family protein [Oscillatoria salina]NET86767.1 mechanosensitive ion channel family protein [Kamptonema sp. SIO1D9]